MTKAEYAEAVLKDAAAAEELLREAVQAKPDPPPEASPLGIEPTPLHIEETT